MQPDARICPFCGETPGSGVFCASCGRNLAGVDRLPTRAEWEAERRKQAGEEAGNLAERCTAATKAFLEAMHEAGDPGTTRTPVVKRSAFGRTPTVEGWIVRPVGHDDDHPTQYEPGLVLTTEGAFHRLGSEVRGWGQRDFPQYHHTASAYPVDVPVEERLIDELSAVLREHGVAGPAPR
jgi:hypothetical protein